MKQLILKIKQIQRGGLFKSGWVIVNPILREDDKETDLGDFALTSDYCSAAIKLRMLGREYRDKGYELVGDWDV